MTSDDVREYLAALPRSYEVFVRGRWKFRVGQIVYVAFSKDEKLMGFAFPKEERQLTRSEMQEYAFDAWRMVVPKKVAASVPSKR